MTIDILWILFIVSNFFLLGSSRLHTYIRVISLQGFLLSVLPWFSEGPVSGHIVAMSLINGSTKGILFPWLLSQAIRRAEVRREIEPFIGYGSSLFIGLLGLLTSFWIGNRLIPPTATSVFTAAMALFTLFVGLFLIMSRRKAITQALGYLVMENGISILGMALLQHDPVVVELGILLDAFAAIFVMGIIMFHINQEFDHMDTDRLNQLKD
ncbi:MAG TPA: hydrogenase [Elusimicrobiota bacterium]|nr:hydrogenase [Elusimicrobiota bacterium]